MMASTPSMYPRRSSLSNSTSSSPYDSRLSASARGPLSYIERLLTVPSVHLSSPPSPLRVATPSRSRPPIAASPTRGVPDEGNETPRLIRVGLRSVPTAVLAEGYGTYGVHPPPRPFTFLAPPTVTPKKATPEKERSDEWSVSSGALSSSYGSSVGWVAKRGGYDRHSAELVDIVMTEGLGGFSVTGSSVGAAVRPSTARQTRTPVAPRTRPPTSLSAARASLRSFAEEWTDKTTHSQHYGEGGYLGASCGVVINHRYTLLEKLGWGEFSTVWLARDALAASPDSMYVAIKVARCSQAVSTSAKYEVALLKYLRSMFGGSKTVARRRVPMTPLIDAFEHRGPHGFHACVVLPAFGPNLLCVIDVLKRKRRRLGVSEIQMLKHVIRDIATALADLEGVGVLHTDLKPENVLLAFPHPRLVKTLMRSGRLSSEEAERLSASGDQRHAVVLADFGLSVLMDPESPVGPRSSFKVVQRGRVLNTSGTLIQTREYRAPEVIVGSDFECRTDVWSLGCLIYEIISGDFLFDPKRKTRVERDMDIEHLAMMMQIHGPMSAATMARGSATTPRYGSRYFAADGTFLYAEKYASFSRRSLETELSPYIGSQEAAAAADLIASCVQYNPSDRLHASEVVNHIWLQGVNPEGHA